jgi:hypothetical protein
MVWIVYGRQKETVSSDQEEDPGEDPDDTEERDQEEID